MRPPPDPDHRDICENLRDQAKRLGFTDMGIASAEPLVDAGERLRSWLERGDAGTMDYMVRTSDRRADPSRVLPGVRSIITLAHPYYPGEFPPAKQPAVKISRYAWGRDYHNVLDKKLASLERSLKAMLPNALTKRYVDTGPVLEKSLAERAGIGFIGKNTLLITSTSGSWVFLAEILTTQCLDPTSGTPSPGCGTCRACLDACPTGALTNPFQLDARRCISYLTIENKGPIPEDLSDRLSGWGFGCDICQEVCPYNKGVEPTRETQFRQDSGAGPYMDLSSHGPLSSEPVFRERFSGTPLMRAKYTGMRRNVAAVLHRRGS